MKIHIVLSRVEENAHKKDNDDHIRSRLDNVTKPEMNGANKAVNGTNENDENSQTDVLYDGETVTNSNDLPMSRSTGMQCYTIYINFTYFLFCKITVYAV